MRRPIQALLATVLLTTPVACRQLVIGHPPSGSSATGGTSGATGASGTGTSSASSGVTATASSQIDPSGGGFIGSVTAAVSAGSTTPTGPTPATYTLNVPTNNLLDDGLIYSMIDAFNSGVGRSVLNVPLTKPSSNLKWEGASTLGQSFCSGKPLSSTSFALALNSDQATSYLANPLGDAKLTKSPLYLEFLACVGAGMGLPASTDAADVMGPDPSKATNLDAFYAQVKALQFQ